MKILSFLLTKTGALRWLAKTVAGLLSSWGVIGENNIALVSGAVLGILTAIVDQLIEGKKASDAAKLQAGYGLKPDGWIGPVSRATIPGGEYNPDAEVRRAEPVRTQGRGRLGLLLVLLIPALWLTGCAQSRSKAIFDARRAFGERNAKIVAEVNAGEISEETARAKADIAYSVLRSTFAANRVKLGIIGPYPMARCKDCRQFAFVDFEGCEYCQFCTANWSDKKYWDYAKSKGAAWGRLVE
jgi:hypothetical protein